MATSSHVFFDGDVPLAARMHREADDLYERQPAVIVMGSWLTVKEQMADGYAAALARRGYTAFSFDFAGFGASGGELRQTEMPTRKIANIAAAVRYVSSLSFVAPGGPAVVAVCASAQYALAALGQGVPVASFASVAGWFHDQASLAGFYGGAAGVRARLERASVATEEYLHTRQLRTVPAYAPGDERAGMFFELDYYGNAARGRVPEWRNEMTELTWAHWLTFDGLGAARPVAVPSLFVHGDGCVFPENVRTIAKRLTGPVEIAWGDGTQTDFYDRPAQMSFALDAIDHHFRDTLAPDE
ncbi:MAG TPA: hypothetical protein VFQ38_24200 [Longimicrobiales bacterium]|nr:hypothetical protein [Longimicrobiales bacterium]